MSITGYIGIAFCLLTAAGIAYQAIALVALTRFFAKPAPLCTNYEAVTLLKPLHGDEPRLQDNLNTFVEQNYSGQVQMICGVGDQHDSALGAVNELITIHPQADIVVAHSQRPLGANAKIGNLSNMMQLTKHDVLIQSDSDIAVEPEYIRKVIGALNQPGVGAVSCLYTGRGEAGLWSDLDAAIITYSMLPKVVMSLFLGAARPCMGSTIALRRETLDTIGGFERFADVLADDHAIGQAIAAQGLRVEVPTMVVSHSCFETSFGALWRQQLRWAVTIRGVTPVGHIGSGVVHAVPLALITIPFMPALGSGLTLLAICFRIATAHRVNCIIKRKSAALILVPVADCIEFAVWAASLVARRIHWRGNWLTMANNGRI